MRSISILLLLTAIPWTLAARTFPRRANSDFGETFSSVTISCLDGNGVLQGAAFLESSPQQKCSSSITVQAFVATSDPTLSVYSFAISGLSDFALQLSTSQTFTDAGAFTCNDPQSWVNCGADPTVAPYSASLSATPPINSLDIAVTGSGDGLVFYVVSQADPPQNMTLPATINLSVVPNLPVTSLAHFAAGGSYVTGITVVNSGTQLGNFNLSFLDANGAPASVAVSGLGSRSTISGSVAPGGMTYFEAGTGQSQLASGWIQVTANSSLTVQALFRQLAPDGNYYEASVPTSPATYEFLIPFDATTFTGTGAPIYTGLAIANIDSATSATVACTARTANGIVLPNAITVPQLKPYGHWADYLFPILNGNRGTLDCTSNTLIAAIGLRFLGNNAFSSLPVILK